MKEKSSRNILAVVGAAVLAIASWSCSTSRNRWLNRQFHSINTKYNWYFNARELFKEAVRTIESKWTEDYDTLPSIFIWGRPEDVSAVSEKFNTAIEKARKGIEKHSMFIKGTEYNTWVDNCYLLIGKCYLYQGNFDRAISYLEYAARITTEEEERDEAMAWRIAAHVRKGDIDMALTLSQIALKALKRKKGNGILYAAIADAHLHARDTVAAIQFLEKAIENAPIRKMKRRWQFITGILMLKMEDCKKASTIFMQLAKKTTDFKIELYSRLYYIWCARMRISEKIEEMKKLLQVKKFAPYMDVIHLHLGEYLMWAGDTEQALQILEEGTRKPTSSRGVKGKIFLKTGDIYYAYHEYVKAAIAYDSAVKYFGAQAKKYGTLTEKKDILLELKQVLDTINRIDTLLFLASLPGEEAEDIIRKQVRAELQRKKEEQKRAGTGSFTYTPPPFTGNFYFYNPQAVIAGINRFKEQWGNRPLVDNWRVKALINTGFFYEGAIGEASNEETLVQQRMQDIPTSDSMKTLLRGHLVYLLYRAGNIYWRELKECPQALKFYDRILTEFDTSIYAPPSAYYAYQCLKSTDSPADTIKYINILTSRYGNSPYALLVSTKASPVQNNNDPYPYFYLAFKRKYYDTIMTFIRQQDHKSLSSLSPRMLLLAGITFYRAGDTSRAKSLFKTVAALHSDKPEGQEAKKLLQISTKIDSEFIPEKFQRGARIGRYVLNPDTTHHFAIVYDGLTPEPDSLRMWLTSYNTKHHNSNLSLRALTLSDKRVFIISSFSNEATCRKYLVDFLAGFPHLERLTNATFFFISSGNLEELLSTGDLSGYLEFFQQNYSK